MVQELLGEGTFAKVFKATLKQEKPPAPVSVIFHIVVIVIIKKFIPMRIGKRPHISPKSLKIHQILLLYITMICFIFVVK